MLAMAVQTKAFIKNEIAVSTAGALLGGTILDNIVDSYTDIASSLSLLSFGATGNGVTDDTAAITSWLAAGVAQGKPLYAPAGTYKFTSALSVAKNGASIVGDGPYQTVFSYGGISTTIDLISIGDGVTAYANNFFANFRIASSTTMTAGTGLHLQKIGRSTLLNIIIDGQDGNGNLWNGIWFDQIDDIDYLGFQARGQNEALRVNGGAGAGTLKADLHLSNGKIALSGVGLHVGGAFGGLVTSDVELTSNARNCLIDTALAFEANREIFFGSSTLFDVTQTVGSFTAGVGVEINDTLGSGTIVKFAGTWNASAASHGIQIDSGVISSVTFDACHIFNNGGDGIHNLAAGSFVSVNNCTIRNNTSIGVNSTVSNSNVVLFNNRFTSNGGGNFSTNMTTFDTTGGNFSLPSTSILAFGTRGALTIVGGYTVLQDPSNFGAQLFGSSAIGDTTTYYRNTTHNFQNIGGSVGFFLANANGITVLPATTPSSGGTQSNALGLSNIANFGIFWGSNVPTLSAAQGSLYFRTDGSSSNTRAYINANSSTGWTAILTSS